MSRVSYSSHKRSRKTIPNSLPEVEYSEMEIWLREAFMVESAMLTNEVLNEAAHFVSTKRKDETGVYSADLLLNMRLLQKILTRILRTLLS